MMIIELSSDRFGRAMKAFHCIEEKLADLKDLFEEEEDSSHRTYTEEEEEYPHRRFKSRYV
jgi:hypothetical protein